MRPNRPSTSQKMAPAILSAPPRHLHNVSRKSSMASGGGSIFGLSDLIYGKPAPPPPTPPTNIPYVSTHRAQTAERARLLPPSSTHARLALADQSRFMVRSTNHDRSDRRPNRNALSPTNTNTHIGDDHDPRRAASLSGGTVPAADPSSRRQDDGKSAW